MNFCDQCFQELDFCPDCEKEYCPTCDGHACEDDENTGGIEYDMLNDDFGEPDRDDAPSNHGLECVCEHCIQNHPEREVYL